MIRATLVRPRFLARPALHLLAQRGRQAGRVGTLIAAVMIPGAIEKRPPVECSPRVRSGAAPRCTCNSWRSAAPEQPEWSAARRP